MKGSRKPSVTTYLTGAGLIAVLLSLLTLSASEAIGSTSPARGGAGDPARVGNLAVPSGTPVYLPLVMRGVMVGETIFGAEIGPMTDGNGLGLLADAGSTWIRRAAVQWNLVEATEGVYDWSALSGLETELINANNRGLNVILIVRGTPSWAQKVPGYSCGPILASKFGAFANFLTQLVNRYKGGSYQVKFWEIWNEPDIDPSLVFTPDSLWGCWGDATDTVGYGGGYYADMLKTVYPAVKSADPNAQVLVGGLLLDCDPNNPPPAKDCTPAKFLNGVLDNGGGPYFDGVSFHAYDYYDNSSGAYWNGNWSARWNTTGPSTIPKADYIKNLLSAHSVSGKYVMNTEAAVLCFGASDCTDTWETTKAYFVAEVYAAAIAEGLRANIWYFWRDRNSQLFGTDLTPLPAYDAFVAARREMADGTFSRVIGEYTGMKGYEVSRQDRKVWLLWSIDGSTHSVSLPGTPLAAYDVYGASLPVSNPISIDRMPVYLEWSP